jgi:Sulfotransferase family
MDGIVRYSIIIPLEFHRGLTGRCIAGWTRQQTFSRDQFEVIVAAPASHAIQEREEVAGQLGPQDRLIVLEADHDMPLVAEAAKIARGEVLVFTEAHCLPRPDFLEQATRVLDENPAWSGFSGRSIPITHNLLSEIEAGMYERDIQRNLETHPWLKVLDQCFVVRASAYRASGGVEPEYGHFAEWLLAARLHRARQTIGYDPRPAIEHYYCGDLKELEAFTRDFSRGQARFCHNSATDSCGDLFEEVPLWSDRLRFDQSAARCMWRMLRRDCTAMIRQRTTGRPRADAGMRLRDWPFRTALKWLMHSVVSLDWRIRFCELQIRRRHRRTQKTLDRGDRQSAARAFADLMDACSIAGYLNYIRDNQDGNSFESPSESPTRGSQWSSGICQLVPSLGFHSLETRHRTTFRWSEPAAMVKIPPLAGNWTIRIEWLEVLTVAQQSQTRFYVNEKPVSPEQVRQTGNETLIQLDECDGSDIRFSWVIRQFKSGGDDRSLGCPITQISWVETREPVPSREIVPVPTEGIQRPLATYFLHVPKCAGTTTRLVLYNGTAASRVLGAREPLFYYARQLQDGKCLNDDYEFAAGHFGWELPNMVTHRPWRILTMVREPFRRFQSKFDYFRQLKRISEGLTFTEWLEQEIDVRDVAVAYFVPGMLQSHSRGASELLDVIRPCLQEAIANLRQCVVGVQESLEASLNLFADAWPCLLPPMAPRVNVTIDRLKAAGKPENLSPAFAEILEIERELYREAVALFHSQHAALKQRIEETIGRELQSEQEMREYLREKYLASVAVDGGMDFRPDPAGNSSFHWDAAERYLGSNLHDRERHGGQWLRWTGPEPVTEFLLPVPPNTDYRLTFQLHMATPPAHGIGASLQIEGQPVPLVVEWSPKEFRMEAIVSASQFPDRKGKFARIAISHPVVREANAFRHVGLALISIEVATIGPEFFSDLGQLEADDVTVAR